MTFNDFLLSQETLVLPNGEILYNLKSINISLSECINKKIEMCDCIITPYYISDGKRMEFYEFELNVRLVDKPAFEKYLLIKTGKKMISEVPERVLMQQKMFYIEIQKKHNLIPVSILQKHINFLLNNDSLIMDIVKAFGDFKMENLFIAYY